METYINVRKFLNRVADNLSFQNAIRDVKTFEELLRIAHRGGFPEMIIDELIEGIKQLKTEKRLDFKVDCEFTAPNGERITSIADIPEGYRGLKHLPKELLS